ncbi:MAG: DUF1634 domain-containing protein [Candidatus Bathyarchaeota archaeon]|nr:DUF1634 domain-containing protein [Candidatus Bathyarchaeota archaeon]
MVERRMESRLSFILRVGVVASAALMVLGLALNQITGDVSCPTGILSLEWMLFGDPFLAPSHVLFLGFMILLATPVARIVYSAVSFTVRRDYVYAALTSFVLLVLIFSFTMGVGG